MTPSEEIIGKYRITSYAFTPSEAIAAIMYKKVGGYPVLMKNGSS
jgi:hypothetical protein